MSDPGVPAGWYDDPTHRFQRRYFDGAVWTDHVANGSEVATDPIRPAAPGPGGGPPTPPWSTPEADGPSSPAIGWGQTAPMTTGVTTAEPPTTFLDSLGPDARDRPAPDFPMAMGGIGGLLVGGGIVALIGQSGEQVAIVLAGVLTFAAALAVMLFVAPRNRRLASPAVSAAVVGLFITVAGLIVGGDNVPGADAPSLVLLFAGLLHLVAWVAPGFRGRPLLLGLGLVAVPLGLAGLVVGGNSCNSFDSSCNAFEDAAGSAGLSSGAGIVLAIIGCGMLFIVRKLDAIGRHGVATTFAAACIINLAIGAFALAIDLGDTGGPLLVAVAGIALGVVGHLGRRRGLTWTGAALAAGGLATAVFNLVDADSGTVGGVVAVATGAVVIGGPYLFTMFSDDRTDDRSDAS